jgi:hypothetical protein
LLSKTSIYFNKYPWVKHLQKAKSRCNNPNHASYKNYGMRGIICSLSIDSIRVIWFRDNAFELKRPSLDRINSNGNYEIKNCRFIELSKNIGNGHLSRTHCPHGHEYSKINTYRNPNTGYRSCKKCNCNRSRIVYKNKKEKLYV